MVFYSDSDFNLSQPSTELLFIDSQVNDYQNLISGVKQNTKVVLINSADDGIEQISQELTKYKNISSIHLVSHGTSGTINLGASSLSFDNFDNYSDSLENWSESLTDAADIVVYGCNVAESNDGQNLIDQLALVTDADVAASTDPTGNHALGGDWQWEYRTGKIETDLVFDPETAANYENILAGSNHDHNSLLNLVPHSQATHVAIKNGDWFDPNTWQNGEIPGDEADVLIPQGYRVLYGKKSDSRIDTLRVDGVLRFQQQRNSKMLIDTMVVSPQGKLIVGTQKAPIKDSKQVQIVFTSDRAIDTEWDSQQISRGLVSLGEVLINGADKLDFISLENDAKAGDNQLVLELPEGMNQPQGWQVGDRLVLGGTEYNRRGKNQDNSRFQDEVLKITAINGNKISFINENITSGDNTVLRFNHQRPDSFEKELELYVANTTRNVSFSTENGETAPIQQRGHVMFMHNPRVNVNNAGFYNLGRTDKNKLIDDPGQNVDGSKGGGTNPRGRYSLHFHRIGADNPNSRPVIARGNAVVDSPGWGISHHESHAIIEDNVVFDVVGTGIAAEAGNEIGWWRNNITIKTTGDNNSDRNLGLGRNSLRTKRFDYGFDGEGYWLQGAGQVGMVDNIAISSAGSGVMHYGGGDAAVDVRDVKTILVKNLPSEYQSIARGTRDESVVDVSAVPLRQLSGFQSYNSNIGIGFWASIKNVDGVGVIEGTTPDSQPAHQFYSQVDDFQVWNSRKAGVHFQYSSQVKLDNGLILSDTEYSQTGILGNAASLRFQFDNLHIQGFDVGMNVPLDEDLDFVGSRLKNSVLSENTQTFETKVTTGGNQTGYPSYFQIIDSAFDSAGGNNAPTAKFTTEEVGGLAIEFDASTSFDGDSSDLDLKGSGIVSYGWDFNNDGVIDKFGRQVSHYFDKASIYPVTLTVWDNQGETSTTKQNISVKSKEYQNLVADGSFKQSFSRSKRLFGSLGADRGWISSPNWSRDSSIGDGAAVISAGNNTRGIGQALFDNGIRRGQQSLSLDIKNTEKDKFANGVSISVWGVNGQFENPFWSSEGPQQLGAIPMTKEKLLEQKVGGETFDWTTMDWDLDFGDGYQYVVVQVNPIGGINPDRGDFFAIDNVKIS